MLNVVAQKSFIIVLAEIMNTAHDVYLILYTDVTHEQVCSSLRWFLSEFMATYTWTESRDEIPHSFHLKDS